VSVKGPRPPVGSAQNASAPHSLLGELLHGAKQKLPWSGPGSTGQAGWALEGAPPPRDVTAQFESAYAVAKAGGNPLPAEAKGYRYLMVGGLFTSHYPGYFKQNQDALKAAGLDVQDAPIDTGGTVEANAKALRDAIMSSGDASFVLVGQSKGGVDIAAALALYPEIKPHVRAVVSMQAPYGGTPIASDLEESPALSRLLNDAIQKLFKAQAASLADLSYASRRAFVGAHPYPDDVPTLCLASSRADGRSVLFDTAEYMLRRYGLASDGLVPTVDAIIPGAELVKLTNMDHADGVLRGVSGFQNYSPGPLTTALVAVALQMPPS
jgi:triacylglycerol lipase